MENSEADCHPKFQPFDVPESPVSQKQGNLTGSPRLVQDLSADLYNMVQDWNREHLNGVGVISEICNLKIMHLGTQKSTNSIYPSGLQELCDKLEEVCDKLTTFVRSLREIIHRFEGVMKLNEMKKILTPIFTTWRIDEYVQFSKKILLMYEKELQLKLYLKENIGHAVTEENVLLYQTIWVQQPYIDDFDLQMEAMLKETNLRQ